MQSQGAPQGWCLSAGAARQGTGPGTGMPGCSASSPSASCWLWRDADDFLLSLAVGAALTVGHCLALAVATHGGSDGARTAGLQPLPPSWPLPLPPPHRTCLCHLPAGADTYDAIPRIPGPLVSFPRGCLSPSPAAMSPPWCRTSHIICPVTAATTLAASQGLLGQQRFRLGPHHLP